MVRVRRWKGSKPIVLTFDDGSDNIRRLLYEFPKEMAMTVISGLAWHIEEEIRKLLKRKIPEACTLEFEESEESHSVGVLMDDHDEFNGRLVVTLIGAQTKTLTSLKSTNTFRESVSGGSSFDRNQYHYSIKETTFSKWFQNDPAN